MKKNKKNKLLRVSCVLLAVFILLAILDGALLFLNCALDKPAHALPSYTREDITPLLEKKSFSEEDYEILYRQTGLSKEGILRTRSTYEHDEEYFSAILAFQNALFTNGKTEHEIVNAVTTRDLFYPEGHGATEPYLAPIVPLYDGDIILSLSCHAFGWRHGHAGLVVNGANKTTLESVSIGKRSEVAFDGAEWFQVNADFIVMRLKPEYNDIANPVEVAKAAVVSLYNIPYSLTVGVFARKDQGPKPKYTQCGHLIWQAYKNFGIDLDSDGGLVVTPQDIADSPYLEVVQVYGYDPLKLW